MSRVYSFARNMYDTKGSDVTSQTVFIGDAVNSTVVVTVAGDGSSSATVEVSSMDGFDAALAAAGISGGWSAHSVVANPNSYKQITDIPDGTRWVRALRSESAMSVHISFQGQA